MPRDNTTFERPGWKKVNGEWKPTDGERIRLRADTPSRTVSECKQACLDILNAQLWSLECSARENGLTPYEEDRLLALLRGFNAALPKNVEETPLDLSKMELDDLKRMAGK